MSNLGLLDEACASLPHSRRPMFGVQALFAPNGGVFAAVTDDDRIVLKFADETARAQFEALGGAPWTYRGRMTMKEWLLVPDEMYDDPRALAEWARRAHALAKPSKKRSSKKPGA